MRAAAVLFHEIRWHGSVLLRCNTHDGSFKSYARNVAVACGLFWVEIALGRVVVCSARAEPVEHGDCVEMLK